MKTLFLAWQNPESREWFPIGRLTQNTGYYSFVYIQGVQQAQKNPNFQPLTSFPDLSKEYHSDTLFPLFANRIMRPSRPDYQHYLECLNLNRDEDDPIAILSRSGGKKATDHFEVFPCPQQDENGFYHIHFFLHGLRHRSPEAQERCLKLEPCVRLFLMHDLQNPFDPMALALRTQDDYLLGYCPRYLVPDIHTLLRQNPDLVQVTVERINLAPTPIQLRLLCNMTAQWPNDFRPFSTAEYQPVCTGFTSVR